MKISIIPEDKCVVVDGAVLLNFDFKISTAIHAVQWEGESGHIEYADRNESITEFPYDDIVSDFNIEVAARAQAEALREQEDI
jgi:predicted dinucleotide-utilizing enzyme